MLESEVPHFFPKMHLKVYREPFCVYASSLTPKINGTPKSKTPNIFLALPSAVLTHGGRLGFALQTTVHKNKFLFISMLLLVLVSDVILLVNYNFGKLTG